MFHSLFTGTDADRQHDNFVNVNSGPPGFISVYTLVPFYALDLITGRILRPIS